MSEPDFAEQRRALAADRAGIEQALAQAEASLGVATLDQPAEATRLRGIIGDLKSRLAAFGAAEQELDRREAQAKAEAAELARVTASRALAIDLDALTKAGPDLLAAIDALGVALAKAEAIESAAYGHATEAGLELVPSFGLRPTLAQLVAAVLGWQRLLAVDKHLLKPADLDGFRTALTTKRTTRPRPARRSPWAA